MNVRLVVGLGNPGPSYQGTRHSVGRDFISRVALDHKSEFAHRRQAEIIRLPVFYGLDLPEPVAFARLDCFMNLSGPGLQRVADGEGVGLDQTLIVVDDFMIPFGALRLRGEGSAGGHNGLKSIIETFGDQAFPRLRVGVGPVPTGQDPADFVLARFSGEERRRMDDLFGAMTEGLKQVFSSDLQRAMTAVNRAHF